MLVTSSGIGNAVCDKNLPIRPGIADLAGSLILDFTMRTSFKILCDLQPEGKHNPRWNGRSQDARGIMILARSARGDWQQRMSDVLQRHRTKVLKRRRRFRANEGR